MLRSYVELNVQFYSTTVEIKSREKTRGNAIYFLAGILFFIYASKMNPSFNLIKKGEQRNKKSSGVL